MTDGIEFHGDLIANLRNAVGEIAKAAEDAVSTGAETVLDASDDMVPVDTGDLRGSRNVQGSGLRRQFGYNDPISVIVHEDMTAQHQRGQAKYLETAMNSKRDEVRDAIAAVLRRLFQ